THTPLELSASASPLALPSFPTRRSSDLVFWLTSRPPRRRRALRAFLLAPHHSQPAAAACPHGRCARSGPLHWRTGWPMKRTTSRSEEHTSELQSHLNLVCRLLLERNK